MIVVQILIIFVCLVVVVAAIALIVALIRSSRGPANYPVALPRSPRPPASPARAPALAGREIVSGNGRLRVDADRRPLWEARGWRREGSGRLVGAYRTPIGACRGEIVVDAHLRPHDFYILGPPRSLLKDPRHGACFRSRGGDRFWIHFSLPPSTVDGGIVQVEQLLREALRRPA